MALAASLSSCGGRPGADTISGGRAPEIYPQLSGATLPVNIAAPSFIIKENGDRFYAEVGAGGCADAAISVKSGSGEVTLPLGDWHDLLKKASESGEKEIWIRVVAENDGKWVEYDTVRCPVSRYPIDEYLVYRLLYPGYELWNEMGIYQRNLTNYEQTAVVENSDIERKCVNCHSFVGNSPERMMMHVRGPHGGTLIALDGVVEKVSPNNPDLPHGATYPSWHPSGRFIAFSANEIRQFFHTSGTKTIEVSDLGADMTVYDVEKKRSYTSSSISGEDWMETFPSWAPNGSTLYFCRAKGYRSGAPLDSIRYDLCRVEFDTVSCTFGDPEVVIAASESGKSMSFPRVSPDGKWLLFTMSDYGNFSIWHSESDLWLLNLSDGSMRSVDEVNSDDVDSYHSWSSDGRWIVFSSKRMDGLWARPFIASFDSGSGVFGKAFALPQAEALFYDNFTRTFNIPELVKSPVDFSAGLIEAANRE